MKKILIALSAIGLIIFGASVLATVPSGDTENMKFSEHGTYARLDEYNGGQTKINVPETYNGLPVTTIGADAFNDASIERIYLPITVTTVETDAFINCGDQVHVVLELINELADVPKDVANWGLGDFTARIRNFTATGRSDLFIEKGEIIEEEPQLKPDDITDCSNIKAGIMADLIFESNLDNETSYTGITYTKEIKPPEDAYDISLGRYVCSRGQEKCVQMWAEGTEIYITFCGDVVYLEDDVTNYYTTICTTGTYPVNGYVLSNIEHISGLEYVDTTKVTNMSHMFCQYGTNTPKLRSLDLSNFNTSNTTDMTLMFADNRMLEYLDVSSFDTKNVNDMFRMFYGLESLETLDLSNFNTSKVTNMSGMFTNMKELTIIDIANFDTSNIVISSYMFAGMENLTSLDLSSFNTENVKQMHNMFDGANNLQELDLSSFNTTNVTNMAYMFQGTSSLKSLDLSNFNTSNVTNMAYMFNGASSLDDLDLSNFNTSNVYSMSNMFTDASSLTYIDLSSFDTLFASDNMYNMFDNTTNLQLVSGYTWDDIMRMTMYGGLLMSIDVDVKYPDLSNSTGSTGGWTAENNGR